ncbi:MAG TPA: DMT family transporter [Ktedonobacteraceae bacterium]|nr:DMT family transporter [Ktedonobacteraceae bacterium]
MKMTVVAAVAFLFNTFLFATYYAVSKEAMGRIDPVVFNFFVMAALIPVGLLFIALSWRELNREVIKSGALMGSCLCLGLCTLAVALKYNSATSTAFFPSLNGFLAAVCAWLFARQPINKATWFAGLVSAVGALLLIFNAQIGGPRATLIAFIGGLLCTFYVFVADHEQRGKNAPWALFGVQLLTMAIWASMIALLFGDWQAVRPAMPKDIWAILYISIGTTCLPTLITVWLQRFIAPLTVSFIYILEPVLGALFSYVYLHESLPLDGYIGGGLIVVGALIQTWGTANRSATTEQTLHAQLSRMSAQVRTSWFTALIYPLLCCGVGGFVLLKLGGFPPNAWNSLQRVFPQVVPLIQQGHGLLLSLLVGQALSWLLAWSVLLVLVCLALVRTRRMLTAQPARQVEPDTRSLRQLGMTRARVPVRARRTEDPHIRQRRVQRKKRLAGVDITGSRPNRAMQTSYPGLEMVDMGDRAGVAEQYELFDEVVW